MNRETFIAVMDAIKSQHEFDHRIGKAIDVLSDGGTEGLNNNQFVFTSPINDKLVQILEEAMNDSTAGFISWYIWDTDWGQRADNFGITLKSGKKIHLRTHGDLYDWLVSEDNR